MLVTDILLVHPKYTDGRTEIRAHYGLSMLGGALKRKGYRVAYCDLNFEPLDVSQAKHVGVTCWTMAYPQAREVAQTCQQHHVPCFAGGPHASADPQSMIDLGYDAVCVGEGEEAIIAMMEGARGIIKGGYIADLDTLPTPDLEPRALYPYVPVNHILMTRGCPAFCIFCQQVMGHKVRTRSPEHIAQEYQTFAPGRFLEIIDDCLTYDREWLDRVSHKVAEFSVKGAVLSNGTRVDTLDAEVMTWLRDRLHIKNMMLGLESADPKVLKMNNKGITPDQLLQAVRLCDEAGITPGVFMIVGLPGADFASDLGSIQFIRDLRKAVNWGVAFAFPNTALWRWVEKRGRWLCDPRDYGRPSSPQWDTADYPGNLRLRALEMARRTI